MIELFIILSTSTILIIFQILYILNKYKVYLSAWLENKSIWNPNYDRTRLFCNIIFFGIGLFLFLLMAIDYKKFNYSIIHKISFYTVPAFISLMTYLVYLSWSKKFSSSHEELNAKSSNKEENNNELFPEKIDKKGLFDFIKKDFYFREKHNENQILELIINKDFHQLEKLKGQIISKKNGRQTSNSLFKLNNVFKLYSEDDLKLLFKTGAIKTSNGKIIDNDLFRQAKLKFPLI